MRTFFFLGARKRRKENKCERKKIGKKWRKRKKKLKREKSVENKARSFVVDGSKPVIF